MLVLINLSILITIAQSPKFFKYQAIIRDNSGNPIKNQSVYFRISLLRSNTEGNVSYSEAQSVTTNDNGLVNLSIGSGTNLSGSIDTIQWGKNSYFIKIEMKTDGNTYNLMGISQLLSVPYALYAEKSGTPGPTGLTGNTGPMGPTGATGPLVSGTNSQTLRNNGTNWVATGNLYNDGTNIGIGTSNPQTKLDIAGKVKISDGTQAASKVLTSDAAGNASWQNSDLSQITSSYPSGCIQLAGSIATGSLPQSVAISGKYAYVVNKNTNSLTVYDISNPASITQTATVVTGNNPVCVAVSGDNVFVLNSGSNTMKTYYIWNNGTSILDGGTIATGSNPSSIAISGNYAYVTNRGSNNMFVYDITTPANPSKIATIATATSPVSIAVGYNNAFVVNQGSNSLYAYDITNPALPKLVCSTTTGSYPSSVYFKNEIYVVNGQSNGTLKIYGLVYDMYGGVAFELKNSIAVDNAPASVSVSGNFAYVINSSSNTLTYYNISDVNNLKKAGSISTDNNPLSLVISGNYAYVVNNSSSSLQIFQTGCEANLIVNNGKAFLGNPAWVTQGNDINNTNPGKVIVKGGLSLAAGSSYTNFNTATQSGNINYTLPATQNAGALMNDGSGTLSWKNPNPPFEAMSGYSSVTLVNGAAWQNFDKTDACNCASITINAPSAGKIVVEAYAQVYLLHFVGNFCYLDLGISNSYNDGGESEYQTHFDLPSVLPTFGRGYSQYPFSVRNVFTITTAGTYTYYLNGRFVSETYNQADDCWLNKYNITAEFHY